MNTKNLLLNLLFPPHCLSCKQIGSNFCNSCASLIRPNKTQHCYKCGKAALHAKTCEEHFKKKTTSTLNGLLITAHYNGNPLLKKAIKTMKYKKIHEDISEQLALLAIKTLKPFINASSSLKSSSHSFILIPVPLHLKRLKERGFNQSELLSKKVIQKSELKDHRLLTIDHQLLKRSKNTLQQAATKSRKDRLKNLNGAFQVNNTPDPNKIYILIDDVSTTGTTLEECCKTLKQAGAKGVWGLVLGSNK